MKQAFVSLGCLFIVAGVALAQKPSTRKAPSAPKAQPSPPKLIVGQGKTVGNLTLFPVSSPTLRDDDRFTTLDEGLKAGTVEIREIGAANSETRGRPQRSKLQGTFARDALRKAILPIRLATMPATMSIA
jgi:hypothetical protein